MNLSELDYLRTLITPLLSSKCHFDIETVTDERGVLLTVTVDKEEMGKLIGKKGDTARALRHLLHQFGMANDKRVSLKINEPS